MYSLLSYPLTFFIRACGASIVLVALVGVLTLFAPHATAAIACMKYDSSKPIPTGYGAAYYVWDVMSGTLLYTQCNASTFSILIGNEHTTNENFAVYKTGYRWTGSMWQAISFTPDGGDLNGNYIRGKAKSESALSYAGTNSYFVAYTCSKQENDWKCGCRDTNCSTRYWQLQAAVKPSTVTPTNTITTGSPQPALTLDSSYTLGWRDEFDGNTWSDKWVDREPWQSEPGYTGYGGGAWMRLPYGSLAEEAGGMLTLRARKCSNPNNLEMCGAELSTRGKYQTFKHGYIEARVKNPGGADLFPALWLMGNGTGSEAWPRTGEIDIFEFVNNGHDTGIPFFTTHWYGSSCNSGHCQKTYTYPARVSSYATGFHTWGMKRTSDVLEVYIDGTLSSKLTRSDLAAVGGNYDVIFNEPMHLRIDISAGGTWANDTSKAAEEGDLIFDYIRVWEKR